MPLPTNLSFETQGATAGTAAAWSADAYSSASAIGNYGTGARGETFEKWITGYRFSGLQPGDTIPGGTEDFASWVPGYAPLYVGSNFVTGVYSVVALPPGTPYEDFTSWGTTGYELLFAAGHVVTGLYDTGSAPAETFALWVLNYRAAFFGGDVVTGSYYGGTQSYEDFSVVVTDVTFYVASAPTDTFQAPGHALANNTAVTVDSTDQLPTGLFRHTTYYVVSSVSGTSFKLSATLGGASITVTDAGIGTLDTHGDESRYWTSLIT